MVYVAALLFTLAALPSTTLAAEPEQLRLTPEAARDVAQQALHQGNAGLAAALAQGLLRGNPKDGAAQFVLARAYQQLGQPDKARAPARLSYRLAKTKDDRFHAAQLSARLAVEAGRPTAAKLWLRRSLQHVPDPRFRPRIADDYRILRELSPWHFAIGVTVAPSDNLNNGAQSPYSIIDGIPAIGFLSGSAQALSGLAGSVNATVDYRLQRSKEAQTHIGLRYFGKRVHLSDEARGIAPNVENRDLAFDYAELSVKRRHTALKGHWQYGLAFGQSWSGHEQFQTSYRAHLARTLRVKPRTNVSLHGQVEQLTHADNRADIKGVHLTTQIAHRDARNNQWQADLSLRKEVSDNRNADRRQIRGQASWAPDVAQVPVLRSLAPVFSLGASWQHYQTYNVGLPVPGGRTDRSVFAELETTLKPIDYGGFSPTLTLRNRQTYSNVSRFDTRETTLTLGLKSRF